MDLDEDRALAVIQARQARVAAMAFEAKGVEMSPAQTDTFKRMLDALDARAKRLGIAEEM